MIRSLTTRFLHTALAVAILHQLVISWLMERPQPGRTPGNFAFDLHQTVGLASLGLLGLYWIWVMLRRREPRLSTLLPWFRADRRRALREDLILHASSLARLRLPNPAAETPLASAVHGLGLLIASAMAATGAILYAALAADGSLSALGRFTLDLHGVLANLMWAYLIGHAGVAIIHQLAGHPVLERMFTTGD